MKKLLVLIALLALVLVVAFSGCTEPADTGTTATQTTGGTTTTVSGDGTTVTITGEEGTTTITTDTTTTAGATDWCPAGTSWSAVSDTYGAASEVDAEIVGMTTYKGQQLCQATMTASRPSQPWYMMTCNYYFNEDETVCWIECKDDVGRTLIESSCSE